MKTPSTGSRGKDFLLPGYWPWRRNPFYTISYAQGISEYQTTKSSQNREVASHQYFARHHVHYDCCRERSSNHRSLFLKTYIAPPTISEAANPSQATG